MQLARAFPSRLNCRAVYKLWSPWSRQQAWIVSQVDALGDLIVIALDSVDISLYGCSSSSSSKRTRHALMRHCLLAAAKRFELLVMSGEAGTKPRLRSKGPVAPKLH